MRSSPRCPQSPEVAALTDECERLKRQLLAANDNSQFLVAQAEFAEEDAARTKQKLSLENEKLKARLDGLREGYSAKAASSPRSPPTLDDSDSGLHDDEQPDKHYPPPTYSGKPLTTKQFERRLTHSSRRPLSRSEFDAVNHLSGDKDMKRWFTNFEKEIIRSRSNGTGEAASMHTLGADFRAMMVLAFKNCDFIDATHI